MSASDAHTETPGESGACVRALPWQGEVWDSLGALQNSGRLPHALLLEGVPGTGRNVFADALVRQLLCAMPGPDGNCGHCKPCVVSAGGAHADFFALAPPEPGKAIGIDQVRGAIRFATGTASMGGRKVMRLSPAEAMTGAAFNALLKCLEEPAAGTVMVLVCARGYPLPATIRSRCQRWLLPRPSESAARQCLANALGAQGPAGAAEGVLGLCDFRPFAALAMLQQEEGGALLRLYEALEARSQTPRRVHMQLEEAAAQLEVTTLLDTLERWVQRWVKVQAASSLRSPKGRCALQQLDLFRELRSAQRSGSNPNPDLLRFRALQALDRLWSA